MLSVFPIQFLSLFAFFILRVVMGMILLYLGVRHFKHRRELATVFTLSWWPYGYFSAMTFAVGELLLSGFIIVGAYTQVATLLVAAMSLKLIILHKKFPHPTIPPRIFYVLLFGASLALTITGAGVLAFDLPL